MTYTLKQLEAALPSLRNTVAEVQAERIRTLLLAEADADIRVSNVELGLLMRALQVERRGLMSLTFEEFDAKVVVRC